MQVDRTLCGLVPDSDAARSLDRAPRWCGGRVSCVQICAVMTLRCAAGRARACTVLGNGAVRCVFFCGAAIVQVCEDALRQACFAVLLFSLLLRKALGGYWLSISVGWLQSCMPKDRPNANAF